MKTGTLYLIPVPLAPSAIGTVVPPDSRVIVAGIKHFVVENAKTARQWLKWYEHPSELRELDEFILRDIGASGDEIYRLHQMRNGQRPTLAIG